MIICKRPAHSDDHLQNASSGVDNYNDNDNDNNNRGDGGATRQGDLGAQG